MMLAGGVLLAFVLLGLGLNVTRDARVALFATPLFPEQVTEVQTRLAGWGIPYAPLADNVRVDPRKRSDVLLRLALAGVPHRHLATTDEAFAHVNALTPQSILEAQTRDALAADLAQGLRGLDGVADARVIVAPASGGGYADEAARDASASVRVTLTIAARSTAGRRSPMTHRSRRRCNPRSMPRSARVRRSCACTGNPTVKRATSAC
jgi:flagellar biosynthesis/type III secretory pathway M-ring protein FliF/YscJ